MNILFAQQRPQTFQHRVCNTRKGLASVLAMLYLILFSVLAVGFVQSTALSSQLSRNDKIGQDATTTADGGMQYVRYQLGAMNLPYGTNSANLMANVTSQLGLALNGNPDMGGNTVQTTSGAIYLPSQNGWITVDPTLQTKFQASIVQSGNNLVVTVHGAGQGGKIVRGLQLQYQPAPSPYSLLGLSSMAMSQNAYTDSYNAAQGAYVKAKANSNGSIASNGNITLTNAAIVNGSARCGPASTTTLQNTAKVTGRNAPLATALSYPSVTMPASGTYTDLGDVSLSSGNYSLPGGTYVLHHLDLSGTVQFSWTGPVTLYITDSYSITQSAAINTYQNLPSNRTLNFLPTCTTATWGGNNVCIGTLYAPDTAFTVSGSVELFGRIIAKSITNSSSGGMHNDESMTPLGGTGAYAPVQGSYIEVP